MLIDLSSVTFTKVVPKKRCDSDTEAGTPCSITLESPDLRPLLSTDEEAAVSGLERASGARVRSGTHGKQGAPYTLATPFTVGEVEVLVWVPGEDERKSQRLSIIATTKPGCLKVVIKKDSTKITLTAQCRLCDESLSYLASTMGETLSATVQSLQCDIEDFIKSISVDPGFGSSKG